jgi:hypothetical protein
MSASSSTAIERWFAINGAEWAATTVKRTRSITDRQLAPGLGRVLVRELEAEAGQVPRRGTKDPEHRVAGGDFPDHGYGAAK